MEMEKIYADDYNISFVEEGVFLNFLEEREENASWQKKQSKNLRFVALEQDSELTENLIEEYALAGKKEIITDTLEHTKLLLKAKEGMYPVRSCAIKTILDRARISGNALNKVDIPILARILNYCLKVANGDALLRFSEGKLSAIHAGDDCDYKVLEIPELFKRTVDYLNNHFSGVTYAGGYYEHSMVTAIWELSNNDELIEVYQSALEAHGLHYEEIKPALRLSTSDVGIGGANLYPMLFVGKRSNIISLGSPLKLEHKNGANMEAFERQLSFIYAQFGKSLKSLRALITIEIDYPMNCMAGIMKRIGLTKKPSMEAIELFKAQHGLAPCTAHEIYYGICEVLFILQCSGATGGKIAQTEENIARALSLRFSDYDIPGELKW